MEAIKMKKVTGYMITLGVILTMGMSPVHGASRINPPVKEASIQENKNSNDKMFIGKIIGIEEGKIEVEPLFDLNESFNETDRVYIDLKEASFANESFKKYAEGQLITIYYQQIDNKENTYTYIANQVHGVEDDQIVSIGLPTESVRDEITIQPIMDDTQPKNDSIVFIGVVEAYEDNQVKVKPIFDLSREYSEDDNVYINVSDASFSMGEIDEYPIGYLINIRYESVNQQDNHIEIIAKEVRSLEEDKEVSIQSMEERTTNTIENDKSDGSFLEGIIQLFNKILLWF